MISRTSPCASFPANNFRVLNGTQEWNGTLRQGNDIVLDLILEVMEPGEAIVTYDLQHGNWREMMPATLRYTIAASDGGATPT